MTTSGWALRSIVEPQVEPITIEEARSQCQIDADITAHDTDLNRFIKAAREASEAYCKRSWVEQRWRLSASDFDRSCSAEYAIELPMGPVIRINSITYLNNDGERTALEDADFILDESDEPAKLYPAYNTVWPYGRIQAGSVAIEYTAGYPSQGSPAGADGVPELARQAMLMLVAHWFNNREAISAGSMAEIPYAFERALDPLRIYP